MAATDAIVHRGRCCCGAVRFEIRGPVPPPDACHCTICRRFSGHYWASADVPRSALTVEGEAHVTWYRSSEKVRRGFCSTCGSSLFFDPPPSRDWIGVSMGALESPTRTHLAVHIFVDDQGDYYDIADGVPQKPR